MPFPSSLQSFCWEISCQPSGLTLVCYLSLSLVTLNILSLSLILVNLISMCFSVFLLQFILPGTLWVSWTGLKFYFLSHVSEVFSYYIFKYLLRSSLSCPSAAAAAAAARSLQSCLTLCDPIDGSPPGSPVPGILQTRTLEWVAIPYNENVGVSSVIPEVS